MRLAATVLVMLATLAATNAEANGERWRVVKPREQARAHGIPQRDITVYLPPGYHESAGRRYDTLYLLDGQNVWSGGPKGGWRIDETADRLFHQGQIRPLVIVGIPSPGDARIPEFIGRSMSQPLDQQRAREFTRFMIEGVKGAVDHELRTRPAAEHTAIAGASFGADGALQIAFHRPQVFGKVAALSGAHHLGALDPKANAVSYMELWLNQLRQGKDPRLALSRQLEVVLGTGRGDDHERYFYGMFEQLGKLLQQHGLPAGQKLHTFVDEMGTHDEPAWHWQMGAEVLPKLFPPEGAEAPQ